MKSDYPEYTQKMDKTLEVLSSEFAAVRAGRANASVLDRITVDYYGVPTPIKYLGLFAGNKGAVNSTK